MGRQGRLAISGANPEDGALTVGLGKERFFHKPGNGFEEHFPWEGIARDKSTGQCRVLSIERHCHRPMIGVQIS